MPVPLHHWYWGHRGARPAPLLVIDPSLHHGGDSRYGYSSLPLFIAGPLRRADARGRRRPGLLRGTVPIHHRHELRSVATYTRSRYTDARIGMSHIHPTIRPLGDQVHRLPQRPQKGGRVARPDSTVPTSGSSGEFARLVTTNQATGWFESTHRRRAVGADVFRGKSPS